MDNNKPKVIIYGGNGFVGTHLAEKLSQHNFCIVCLSRSGHKPLHLNEQPWSENVRWCKGDANHPDQALLKKAEIVIVLVGSAPVPTFSRPAYEKQLNSNGNAPSQVIDCALNADVKRVVLMGAQIPFFLNTKHFAYARGKQQSLESAKAFAQTSNEHSSVVLQPGAIFGKRHLANGKIIPIDIVLSPLSKIMPSQFISVDKLVDRLIEVAINEENYKGKFTLLKHRDI